MAMRKKVGVLTFHRCINYGSYWQARCLVEGLRASGRDAVLLDHRSPTVDRKEWRCALEPRLPERTAANLGLYAIKTRRFLRAVEQLPLSRPFALDAPADLDLYDTVVVGSDEVWNLQHPWYGGRQVFFGSGLKTPRLVSYAASFGNHDASRGLSSQWAHLLRSFTAISVRDANSARLIGEVLNFEPEQVLDPCLQFARHIPSNEQDIDRRYIAIYGHGFPYWFKQMIRRQGAVFGYRLLSIGYANDWTDDACIAAGPRDFARLMASAAAVATNFFHGCVFALHNTKPFVCAPSAYRMNKLRDLCRAVGAERHLIFETTSPASVRDLLAVPPDPAIFDRIAVLRDRSTSYLDAAVD